LDAATRDGHAGCSKRTGGNVTTSISRQELQELIADGDVILVETLRAEHYADGHLPGAIHVHFEDVDERVRALIPDLDTPVVTYCSNELCRNSDLAAARLEELGYRHVRRYVGGKQDWIESGLPLEGAEVAAR
jgi:rhodanese-related sulfurtransferase